MQAVNEAYRVLGDATRRAEYDATLRPSALTGGTCFSSAGSWVSSSTDTVPGGPSAPAYSRVGALGLLAAAPSHELGDPWHRQPDRLRRAEFLAAVAADADGVIEDRAALRLP